MSNEFIVGSIIFPIIGALIFLAFNHPSSYRKIYSTVVNIILWIFTLFITYNFAISRVEDSLRDKFPIFGEPVSPLAVAQFVGDQGLFIYSTFIFFPLLLIFVLGLQFIYKLNSVLDETGNPVGEPTTKGKPAHKKPKN